MKLARFVFYLWLFLLPWQTRYFWPGVLNGGFWEYGSYSLFLTDILFLVLVGLVVLFSAIKSYQLPAADHWLKFALLALVLGAAISLSFSSDPYLSLYYFVRLLSGISLIWLVPLLGASLKKISAILVSSALLQALFGLGQFLLQQTWSNKWLGLALHDPAVPGTSVLEVGSERWLRAYGSLPHPNVLAGFLVVALVLLTARYLQIKRGSKEAPIILAFYVLIFAGLIVTFSRAAWLAFGLAFLIFALKIFKTKEAVIKSARLAALLKLSVSSILLVALFAVFWTPLFTGRTLGEGRLEQKSFGERKIYQTQAMEILKSSWLTGVGLGNFTLAVHDKIAPQLPSYLYQPVHNIYLLSWVEIGVLALVFWVLLILWIFKSVRKSMSEWHLILISFLIIGMFDHYWWSLPVGIWVFWLTVSLTPNH